MCVLSLPAYCMCGWQRARWAWGAVHGSADWFVGCSRTSKQKQMQRSSALAPPLSFNFTHLESPHLSTLHSASFPPTRDCHWCSLRFLLLTTITAICERSPSGLQRFVPGRASLLFLLDFVGPPHKTQQQHWHPAILSMTLV